VTNHAEVSIGRFPVDGHVHFHQLDRVDPTLDAAAANFMRVSGTDGGLLGALLLVEAKGEDVFQELRRAGRVGSWCFETVDKEPQTLVARSGQQEVMLVSGQQIRCARGLEVLAIGTTRRFPEGRSLEDTIGLVRAEGVIAVVPWGFGKWSGGRGRLVRELLQRAGEGGFYVGDNGGRLGTAGLPSVIRDASSRGFRVLPGSDPFPFGGDYRRVGAFGFFLRRRPDPGAPWASLRATLEDERASPEPYGAALKPIAFIFNQVWIQVYNRWLREQPA
jgi:hypothetical protein